MAKNHYEGTDAVRHVIMSHNTALVSIPKEIHLRAGLGKGVDVRVDQDPSKPGIITLTVENPLDHSAALKELVEKREAREKKAAAKLERAEKKAAKAAEPAEAAVKADGPVIAEAEDPSKGEAEATEEKPKAK